MLFEVGLSCSYYEKHEKSFFDKIACKIASANQQIEKINVVLEEIKLGLVQITLLQFFRIHFFFQCFIINENLCVCQGAEKERAELPLLRHGNLFSKMTSFVPRKLVDSIPSKHTVSSSH